MSASRPARPRWLIPLVILVLAGAVSGGIAARGYYRTDVQQVPAQATQTAASQPGSTTVRLTRDASLHPEQAAVRRLLQAHFDAINRRDYQAWSRTVTANKVNSKPEPVWQQDYASTRDTDAVVYRISAAGVGKLRILLGFTSLQDRDDAPPQYVRPCIRWRIVYGLTAENGVWKIDVGMSSGAHPWDPC